MVQAPITPAKVLVSVITPANYIRDHWYSDKDY